MGEKRCEKNRVLRAPKLASAHDYPSATFKHQGSGNSFRGAICSLYWFCPIQILCKCWGWSNLIKTLAFPWGKAKVKTNKGKTDIFPKSLFKGACC